jgi:hypothetical protein
MKGWWCWDSNIILLCSVHSTWSQNFKFGFEIESQCAEFLSKFKEFTICQKRGCERYSFSNNPLYQVVYLICLETYTNKIPLTCRKLIFLFPFGSIKNNFCWQECNWYKLSLKMLMAFNQVNLLLGILLKKINKNTCKDLPTNMVIVPLLKRVKNCWAPEVHTCNPSYLKGTDQKYWSLKLTWATSSQDLSSKIPNTKKSWQSGSSGRTPA